MPGDVIYPEPMGPSDAAKADDRAVVTAAVKRARAAFHTLEGASQARLDTAVTAIAWALCREENAVELAQIAVRDTKLGNIPDKIEKVRRKTLGTLNDLQGLITTGIIEENSDSGLTKYAKPVGVVAAITPSTNPASTAGNKAMMALKGGNAIIVAPSPLGYTTTARAVEMMRDSLAHAGYASDLIQVLPPPDSAHAITKSLTKVLMEAVDLVVVTGSSDNVRRAYASGTPAIGVGLGNVPVIIDDSAHVADAAEKIAASKTYDNATSCSSENALVILESVYEETLAALTSHGGYLARGAEKKAIQTALWDRKGHLNRDLIARDADVFAKAAGLGQEAQKARFFLVEEDGTGPNHPLSGEKLALVLTVYRVRDFDAALAKTREILEYQGLGHSCGIHTGSDENARRLAATMPVVRVMVNQAHTFSHGGAFDNALNFTQSMGCGTWGGNSISENLNYRHFLNITHLVKTVEGAAPTEEDLFGSFWADYGKSY